MPQEVALEPGSLFSRRWRLFRPLALGTRSEFRTAWLMKCCFRLEAENLFTWEPARAGRHPGRCLWARVGGQSSGPKPCCCHCTTAIACLISLGDEELTPLMCVQPGPLRFNFLLWSHHPKGRHDCDDRLVNRGSEKRRHLPECTQCWGAEKGSSWRPHPRLPDLSCKPTRPRI